MGISTNKWFQIIRKAMFDGEVCVLGGGGLAEPFTTVRGIK